MKTGSKIGIKAKGLIAFTRVVKNSSFLVFTNTLLKEICFSLKGNHIHEIKWIGGLVLFLGTEFDQKAVRNELNVL